MPSYLALGDSYTCGEAVAPDQTFPLQLVAQLTQKGVAIADPTVIAVTGWTTGELAAGIAAQTLKPPYNLVTLLIGVNNQYRGEAKGYTLAAYKQEFAKLLQQAIHFAGDQPKRVIVLSIPDWGAMPCADGQDRGAIAAQIDAYNDANRTKSQDRGVHYIDITAISRQAINDPSLVASDNLHPSGAMYTQWVTALLPTAEAILRGAEP